MNALSLAAAVRLGGGRIRICRMLIGALIGALIAALARTLALDRLQSACLWLPSAVIMMTAVRGRIALRHPIRHAALLLCAFGLLGGTVLALQGATGSLLIAYALGAVSMTAASACAMRARRSALDVRKARVTCRFRGREAAFDAMIDSGNTLRDYLTHLPVIVIAREQAAAALGLQGLPLRPIFAQTAGGRQMMDAFTPQEIVIRTAGMRACARAVIALSPAMDRDAPALVPASLLEEQHEKQ